MTIPPRLRLRHAVPVAILAVAACSNWQRVGTTGGPTTSDQVLAAFDPAAMYTGLGRLVSAENVNYVGTVAYLAGGGDSTRAIVGISLSNNTLGFQRDSGSYLARYKVDYAFTRSGAPPVQITRDERVRVGSFTETNRTDESLLLQQAVTLAPGTYTLTVKITDQFNSLTGLSRITTTVPVFRAGSVTAPILVYSVSPRVSRNDSLQVLLDPRGTLAYGGDTVRAYVEGFGYTTPTDVPITIQDDRDSVVFSDMIHFTGKREIEGVLIQVAPDKAPLGKLELLTGRDTLYHLSKAVVSFSSSWIVTNFNDLLDMLRYFGRESEISAMRKAKTDDRSKLWRDFTLATDPVKSTPENEALEKYFGRLAYANYRFRDETGPGWRTDRGEALIVMGEPDEIVDHSMDAGGNRYFVWNYEQYRTSLVFQDVSGFSRYRLTPQSRASLDLMKLQLRDRGRP